MPCNCCGVEALDAPFGARRRAIAPAARGGATPRDYCERCGAALPADGPAALFLETVKLLGQLGLASHTRLLLGTTNEDG